MERIVCKVDILRCDRSWGRIRVGSLRGTSLQPLPLAITGRAFIVRSAAVSSANSLSWSCARMAGLPAMIAVAAISGRTRVSEV